MSDRDASTGGRGHATEDREGPTARFPGERRTTDGLFSGTGDRLVHVRPDGSLRDFGYPLSGLSGIERSRFVLVAGDTTVRFEECETTQRYVGETAAVETLYRTAIGDVRRLDLTAGRAHLTRFDLSDLSDSDDGLPSSAADETAVLASVEFSPDGRTDRVGQLRSPDAIEVFHASEADFLASDAGFDGVRAGYVGRGLQSGSVQDGGLPTGADRYEEERLSPSITVRIVPDGDAVTLLSLLTDRRERPRERALNRIRELFDRGTDPDTLLRAAIPSESHGTDAAIDPSVLPSALPGRDGAVADLRVLSLLSAPSGLRIAGPDFDPAYRYSGGYGYTWFRDDAEVSGFLLVVDDLLGLGLDDTHRRNAEMYCRTQLSDGTWPHRVWPVDGSLAPGWANSRIETGGNDDYQIDQTASVVSFLARVHGRIDRGDDDLARRVEDAVDAGVEGLDATLADDGLPTVCQNAWEDAAGRFAHTAATVLEAYAAVAAAESLDPDLRERARERADPVYDGLSRLWVEERGTYAMRETSEGDLDPRYDSASLALASAHRTYDRLAASDRQAGVDDRRLDRLVSHVDGVLDGLYRDPEESAVEGLVRYEGDEWRRDDQSDAKLWTVSTAWGADAATELSALLADRGDPRADEWKTRARDLLGLIEPDGPLAAPTGYLPEQFFDDGTPDSATPLGWPHAIRLSTRVRLAERGLLHSDGEPVTTD
ncbi:glucoamylase [Halalkaliarchaeum desulfuricum]|uniref:Glucoamylase n=1 Tax=Halalkaliarchaeum desulfuricum TaxID=2055893 RepID=A0A343TIV8_9EURY|nr:glycoside hydrolase family 15 protein [Halalkaliarchaeum desulfuricum]AUX09030.1 glucoamylase [Halalkaliarchaeum desulfuricum]